MPKLGHIRFGYDEDGSPRGIENNVLTIPPFLSTQMPGKPPPDADAAPEKGDDVKGDALAQGKGVPTKSAVAFPS